MKTSLERIFRNIAPLPPDNSRTAYSVAPISEVDGYFVGKDNEGKACILINVAESNSRHQAPIRLEKLDVQFEALSLVRSGNATHEGVFTIIRCRTEEPEIMRYFLSICETIIDILGATPTLTTVASAINRLAQIFQRLQNPPSKRVNGLFGELFIIRRCRSPLRAIAAWRTHDDSRFDFSVGDVRLDVKTTTGKIRAHYFSYEQCNPPSGTLGVVASLFVERAAGGISLGELLSEIDRLLGSCADLLLKLHAVVASTLGVTAGEALGIRFDNRLAESSLRFFDMQAIPAIRGEMPPGVSDVHFRSDLTGEMRLTVPELVDRDPAIGDLLPSGT